MISNFIPTNEEYKHGIDILTQISYLIEPYTIFLIADGRPIGTAILIEHNAEKLFLSAHHVLEKIESAIHIQIVQKFDNRLRLYPEHSRNCFKIKYWDPNFQTTLLKNIAFIWNRTVTDLAIMIPDESILATIKGHKYFYPIAIENEYVPVSHQDALVAMGVILDQNKFNAGPFAVVKNNLPPYSYDNGVDYIVCPIKNDTHAIASLGMNKIYNVDGLSGGGLWKIIKAADSIRVKLAGITIAQRIQNGAGDIIFHGQKSINSFLSNYATAHDMQVLAELEKTNTTKLAL
jgi:hypothetical protein